MSDRQIQHSASDPVVPPAGYSTLFPRPVGTWHHRESGGSISDLTNPDLVAQAEAEAGTATINRLWTSLRVKQAIAALGSAGGGWSVATTAAATHTAADGEFILVNVATCTITLPAPVADARVAVKVIFATVTDIQVKTSGAGVEIDGTDHSATGLPLTVQFEQINIISDGTHWWIY